MADEVTANPEMTFNADAFAPETQTFFTDNKIGSVADLAAFASARPAGNGELTLDSKIDPALFSDDVQTQLRAKKIETIAGLADWGNNVEKLVGKDHIAQPAQGETVKWFGEHKDKLGVPEKADGYDLPEIKLPEGMKLDEDFAAKATAFAHERNLPGDVFKELAGFVIADRIAQHEALEGTFAADEAATKAELTKDWGKDYDRNVEIAQVAARELGLDAALLDRINKDLGSPGVVQLMHHIGSKMKQAEFVTGDGAALAGSKEEAKRELEKIEADSDFMKRLNDRTATGHADAVQKRADLIRRAEGL